MTHPWLKGDHLPLTILMLIGIAIMVLSQVGFYLGWWNDFHTPGFLVGLAVAALAFVGNYLLGATARQVAGVGGDVRNVGQDIRQVGHEVRAAHQDIVHILRQIRDRLPPGSAP